MSGPVKASEVQAEAEPRPEGWRNRIVGHGEMSPDEMLANPRNFRIHPGFQQDALQEALDKIGWVQNVIVNKTTGHVVDGHLRVSVALSRGEESLPVTFVELSEDEEALALATLDPIAGLAATDQGALKGLLGDLEGQIHGQIGQMLSGLAKTQGGAAPASPSQDELDKRQRDLEDQFKGDRRDLVDVTCPHCSEEFTLQRDELV